MSREKLKEEEIEFLAKEYKKNPQLFQRESFIDEPNFLKRFGIFIKGKERFPLGYIKFWPQDFIVEEITETNDAQTINLGDFLAKKITFLEKAPTIYATLVKCGLSTIETVEEMSSILKIDRKQIQFAGIKDKDAITSQLISFRKINIKNLEIAQSPYFFLKNVYSGKGVIEVGSLKGNEFTVLVRTDSSFLKKNFIETLNKISEEGFYNFFYLQRFGTPRLINFYWGFFILRGEYQKAALNYLCALGEREVPYFINLRKKIKENFGKWSEIEKILKPFPLIFKNEMKVVSHLKNNPRDFSGALNQIPEQVQLWIFALASLFFNKKLSEILKEGQKLPEFLPLILSNDKKDWLFYKDILEKNGIFSIPFENLKPFPHIQLRKRTIKTKEKVKILDYRIIKEGAILDFILPKAAYATTFLAHLFNLVSGLPPKDISAHPIDTKASLGKDSLEEVLNQFKDVIYPKTEDFIKKLSQE
ncbi:MAG: tRNA pseudouridine(13) synthase TruD [bacterium]|nr:tRNA pseudouridine(13) synthase TruD [bacterium]